MSNTIKKGNEQAFPKDSKFNGYEGLTKREYFAVLAMQAFISCPSNYNVLMIEANAEIAVKQADALINELNK